MFALVFSAEDVISQYDDVTLFDNMGEAQVEMERQVIELATGHGYEVSKPDELGIIYEAGTIRPIGYIVYREAYFEPTEVRWAIMETTK